MVWLTKVNLATDVPSDLRAEFEEYGETVVAQILGRPLTHMPPSTLGVPGWAATHEGRRYALRWLREQHNKEERRRDVGMLMEWAIIILVAFEVVLSIIGLVAGRH